MKCICDRCGKMLDYREMDYTGVMFDNYAEREKEPENWQFCSKCGEEVRDAILAYIKTGTYVSLNE